MALHGKRLSIVIAAAIALVIVLPLAATAAGPAYEGAKQPEYELPSLTGNAVATALANASDGAVSAQTTTDELVSPVGILGTQIGASTAVAGGWLFHTFSGLEAGTYTVTAQMTIDPGAAASATKEGLPGFSDSRSSVVAGLGANPLNGGGPVNASQPVACSEGCIIPSVVSVSVDVAAPNGGAIYIETGLQATSVTQGLGSATAQASGIVTDISIAPAGGAPPLPEPIQNVIRVLVDTVTVDARSAGSPSHISLEDGKNYLIEASGTYNYTFGLDTLADALCSRTSADEVFRPDRFGPGVLALFANGSTPAWAPAAGTAAPDDAATAGVDESRCSTSNTYTVGLTGVGEAVSFNINDDGLNDNLGGLTVKIFELVPSPV